MLQDTIAPASREDRYSGVQALWIKVIIRAVFDWVSYRDSTRLPQKKYADGAHKWLFQSSNLFNSFENICEFLDLSPEKIRKWASSMSKDQVAKIEHLERESAYSSNRFSDAIGNKLLSYANKKSDIDDFEDY